MKFKYKLLMIGAWVLSILPHVADLRAQTINCTDNTDDLMLIGDVFFNYGATTNAFNTLQRGSHTVGQPFVGEAQNQDYTGGYGFWTRFLLPPAAPAVQASEGDLVDRIQVNWTPDPLSPVADKGFNIYRNGALLTTVDAETRSFVDFNVLAGQFYTYTVSGKNQFGEGYKGSALGFLNPNGVVTGRINTFSGNAVSNALVTLFPTVGKAVEFTGDDKIFVEPNNALVQNTWTVSTWVKIGANNPTDGASIIDFGSSTNKNYWIHTLPTAAGKGIVAGIGNGTSSQTMQYVFPAAAADYWHQITITYNGGSAILYVDGVFAATQTSGYASEVGTLFMGQKPDGTGGFVGKIDELRIFDHQLSQSEIQMTLNRTISSSADGLVAYWKFDEGVGSKGFDIAPNKMKSYLCGTTWTNDKPVVQNAGITDATGYYQIEGINYGGGTTFTATASKAFHYNQSLEFNASNAQRADLTTFDLPDTATLTFTVKPFDLSGTQTLLSKQDATGAVQLLATLDNGTLKIQIGDIEKTFGTLSPSFQHIAISLLQNGSSTEATVWNNGTQVGTTETFSGVPADMAVGTPWTLGAQRNGGGFEQYFTGLIDEVAVFGANLPLSQIQAFANIGTDAGYPNLINYFNLNEGIGDSIADMGEALTGRGARFGASWSESAKIIQTSPHEFSPSSKLVTLNPSNTSTDGVDFTDMSTVPVSGYVRYDGTNCFAEQVEILLDGQHGTPPVFTDKDGKFIVDLEPGKTVKLTPSYHGHQFYPNFWDIQNISSPIAGILFRDQTKRSVTGQLAGGECRKSIIPAGSIVKMKVSSLDGCFEKTLQLANPNGRFTFNNLPPFPMAVALIEHSDNTVYNYFQLQGGRETDLTEQNDTLDFIYYSPPQLQVSVLDTNLCGNPMLTQSQKYGVKVRVFQDYYGQRCFLDTAMLHINNNIADESAQYDTLMTEGSLTYRFRAGQPNITAPYLKTISIEAEANDQMTTHSQQAVVLGKRPRQVNFASSTPEIPMLILRDPPGDQSTARMEKGQTSCNTMQFGISSSSTISEEIGLQLGFSVDFGVGLGFEEETSIEFTDNKTLGMSFTTAASYSNAMETCVTANEVFQTSTDENITGADADLFVGGAMNMLFGITDDLRFDTAACGFNVVPGMVVFPDKFNTTFIYTAYHIKNVVIPNLILVGDTNSANRWQSFLDMNEMQKSQAIFENNYSFDAGIIYDRSTTSEKTESNTFALELEIGASYAEEIGFEVDGTGASYTMGMEMSLGVNTELGFSTTKTVTTGFTLSDNDIGDYFTVDVKRDLVYGTPVFKTVSGASSCPYETNTVNRDEVALTVDKFSEVNVPENDAATFKFTLGNTSQTEESRVYLFSLIPESNPLGAVVKIQGGSPLDRPFGLVYQEGQEVIVTVERGAGAAAHVYEDLEFAIFSECEDSRGVALGLDAISSNFYKSVLLDVHFLEPCSPVDIGFPLQNWVWQVASGDSMFITLNQFNRHDPDLELIRVQYRRKYGDGAWINIVEVPKAQLDNDVFKIIKWGTQILADGEYEIRAITQCVGGLNAGISHIISGRFEREAPEILGTPEPGDGVYSAGDEISIRFNEPIRCDLLIQADFFDNNNIGLYNTETDELVDAIISCSNDKITIVPNVQNHFLENKIFRVEVDNIKDLAGNDFIHAQWEFVNDRNNLNWVDNVNVYVAKYVEDIKSETRRIENRGGFIQNYTITGIPDWVRVYPASGTLAPGQVQVVTFEFDSTMVFGAYKDTIKLEGTLGDEPLVVEARVVCQKPEWVVDPNAFAYSSNMVLELDIEGSTSTDIEDVVAAYIGNQLRGTAKLQYVPSVNKYLAFLTVYSNDLSGGDINIQIWDASACALFGEVVENFTFVADDLIGSPQVPQVVHTNSLLLRKIPLKAGWNWISFNLGFPDPSPGAALASMQHPTNDLIKSQTQFSQNYPQLGWLGSLTTLGNTSMYQLRTANADTIAMVGTAINPTSVNIPVVTGWNWIGYLPQTPMTVGEAMSSLVPLNGDLIKSQTEFAQYVAGFGWIGNLVYMQAPNGYLLKMAQPGALTYPANKPAGATKPRDGERAAATHWMVNPANYELNSTLIGILQSTDGQNVTHETLELGAFVNGEVRGSAKAMYVEPLNAYMFFLTMYANTPGELVTFKLFDAVDPSGMTKELSETLYFSADAQHGTVQAPFTFGSGATGLNPFLPVSVQRGYLDVQPNPVHDKATFRYSTGQAEDAVLTISDALGKVLVRVQVATQAGENTYFWNGHTDAGLHLPSGVYFAKVEGSKSRVVLDKKVIVK